MRLARNIAGFPFVNRATVPQRNEIVRVVQHARFPTEWAGGIMWVNLQQATPLDRTLLVERHLVSKQFASADAPRADPPDCPGGPFGIRPHPTLPNPPIVPGPTNWRLADALAHPDPDLELVALGADLEPATLLAAYRIGLFPMDVPEAGRLGWWAPVERGVLHPADLHISRSLARSSRRFSITVDRAFAQVVAGCAAPGRNGAWITPEFAAAYQRLHRRGWPIGRGPVESDCRQRQCRFKRPVGKGNAGSNGLGNSGRPKACGIWAH